MANSLFGPRPGDAASVKTDSSPDNGGLPSIIKPQVVTGPAAEAETVPTAVTLPTNGLPALPKQPTLEEKPKTATKPEATASKTTSVVPTTGAATKKEEKAAPATKTFLGIKVNGDKKTATDKKTAGGDGGKAEIKPNNKSNSQPSKKSSDRKQSPFRIVTVFLILIVAVVSALVYIMGERNGWWSEADVTMQPQKVKVTNITNTTFTVSFLTSDPLISSVQYGTNPNSLKSEVYDDRNKNKGDAMELYTSHHITMTGLTPDTEYYFVIVMQNGTGIRATRITFNSNGSPFSVTTFPAPTTTNQSASVYGNAYRNTQIMGDALTYMTVGNSGQMSGITNTNGKWRIGLSTIYDRNTRQSMNVKDSDQVTILLQEPAVEGQAQTIVTTYAQARNGIDIDVTKNQATSQNPDGAPADADADSGNEGGTEAGATPAPTGAPSDEGAGGTTALNPGASPAPTSTPAPAPAAGSSTVNVNSTDLQIINSTQPTVQGVGDPNSQLQLLISDEVNGETEATVKTDADGRYNYDLKTANKTLSAGEHRITQTNPTTGVTETKSFIVTDEAAGVGGSGTGTGAAAFGSGNPVTPTPVPSPSPEPTPEPTPEPSPSPEPAAEEPVSGTLETTVFMILTGIFLICISMGSYLVIRKDE